MKTRVYSSAVLEAPELDMKTGLTRALHGRDERVTQTAAQSRILQQPQRRWGVVLAGGHGTRLQPLTRFICGDTRPKQYCPLFDGRTLLQLTLRRARLSISDENLVVSLARQHREWYSGEPIDPSQRIVQPSNRNTGPAIAHSLLSIAQVDPGAIVAILPCDHHYADEFSFTRALENAFDVAGERNDMVVLLGATPDYPEVEYGWIEMGSPLAHSAGDLFRVRGFLEKPSIDIARSLLRDGSLWNTFVMVGHVGAFLTMLRETASDLLSRLRPARLWNGEETHIQDYIYEHLPEVSFSRSVLSYSTERMAVLRLNNSGWSDLGDPGRALMAVHDSGCDPAWVREWRFAKRARAAGAHVA